MQLYPCQRAAIDYCISRVESGELRTLVAGPTGIGKSIVQLEIQRKLLQWWIVTPRIEIIRGYLKKRGLSADLYSEEQVIDVAMVHRITTPIRLRNMMLRGDFNYPCRGIIWDEGHHSLADSYKQISLMADVPQLAFTATPYRGTPRQTMLFREQWGEPYWMIRYAQAVKERYIQMPVMRIQPLIDDDIVDIVNGEFQVESLEHHINTRMDDIVSMLALIELDRPTMIAVPTTSVADTLGAQLRQRNIPSYPVLQSTNQEGRQVAFEQCLECKGILIQIDVVSEGVDLPIKRLIDIRPTLSPVKWVQQIGRIMRPGGIWPEYVCTNRNLLRHAYLMDGLVPGAVMMEAAKSFPPSPRAGMRAVGLEAIGRFKPVSVPLLTGMEAVLYNLSCLEQHMITQYAVILHPQMLEPIVARKASARDGDTVTWGKWQQCTPPTDFKGFQSVDASKSVSEKQAAWWTRSARQFGLSDNVKPTAKQFQILPVLSDLRLRIV